MTTRAPAVLKTTMYAFCGNFFCKCLVQYFAVDWQVQFKPAVTRGGQLNVLAILPRCSKQQFKGLNSHSGQPGSGQVLESNLAHSAIRNVGASGLFPGPVLSMCCGVLLCYAPIFVLLRVLVFLIKLRRAWACGLFPCPVLSLCCLVFFVVCL